MKTTKIEWTDKTWNPVTGCSKISAGCQNCYAEKMAKRLELIGQDKYKNGFKLALHKNVLREPLSWREPRTIFVCSMSDLFHKNVPFAFVDQVLETIRASPRHNYQLLTKRAERMAEYFADRLVPPNAWLGVTVESQAVKGRIDALRDIDASARFISCEPLLEDLGALNLEGVGWVIVGGESGYDARAMKKEWVYAVKEQADAAGAAFFFKQWGTWGEDGVKRNKRANGKTLDGRVLQNMPQASAPLFI
jgi:protein gp37